MVPSTRSSSTPVTVMVCGVSQFAAVKVTLAGTVASPVSSDVIVRTTSEVGSASRTIVNVSVLPDSSTSVAASVSSIVNPATSSSRVSTETVWSARSSKLSSDAVSKIAIVMFVVWSPSTTFSSTPVTVTVCGVSQFSDVNVTELGFTEASVVDSLVMVRTTSEVG